MHNRLKLVNVFSYINVKFRRLKIRAFNLLNKDVSIESTKFEFVTAAKIGKKQIHPNLRTQIQLPLVRRANPIAFLRSGVLNYFMFGITENCYLGVNDDD